MAKINGISRSAKQVLLHDVLYGCRLGLDPFLDLSQLSQEPAHWLKSKRHAIFILDKIIKELRRAILIESELRPLYFINFFGAPKKGSDGRMSALRLVRHGSYASKGKISLNDCILKSAYQINTLPNLRTYAELLHGRKWLAARDLSDAFRQLQLHPDDQIYCGYSLFGFWFIDLHVAYGLSSSSANCQRFVELICSIFTKVCTRRHKQAPHDIAHCLNNILAYIDDFLLVADNRRDIDEIERRFDLLLKKLGVIQSASKKVWATDSTVVFGWRWNLTDQTISIPDNKYKEMRNVVARAIYCRCITFAMLKKINGKIMHYSQISRRAKMCLYSSTQAVHKYCNECGLSDNAILLLPISIITHWLRWYELIPTIRTATIASLIQRPSITHYGACDASTTGAGFILAKNWGHYLFTEPYVTEWHINLKEAHAIITLLRVCGNQLSGQSLCLYIDNQAVIGAYGKSWSPSHIFMTFIWEIICLLHKYRCDVWMEYIPSYANIPADALSRQQLTKFHKYARNHNWAISPNPICTQASMKFDHPMHIPLQEQKEEFKRFKEWIDTPTHQRPARWWAPQLKKLFPLFATEQ